MGQTAAQKAAADKRKADAEKRAAKAAAPASATGSETTKSTPAKAKAKIAGSVIKGIAATNKLNIPARVAALMKTHKDKFIKAVEDADASKANGFKNSLKNCYEAGGALNEKKLAAVVAGKIYYGIISEDILN